MNGEINIKHMRILSEPGGRHGNQSNAQIAGPKTERGERGFKSLSAKPMEMRQGPNKYLCAREKHWLGWDVKRKIYKYYW